MVYHSLPWYKLFVPWYSYTVPWYTSVYRGIPWLHHGCTMVLFHKGTTLISPGTRVIVKVLGHQKKCWAAQNAYLAPKITLLYSIKVITKVTARGLQRERSVSLHVVDYQITVCATGKTTVHKLISSVGR